MPTYKYKAINDSGLAVSGTIEADTRDSATSTLAARGLIPTKVISRASDSSRALNLQSIMDRLSPVKSAELILFTKQFRTMTRAGVPMMGLLQVLENQTENQRFKRIIISIRQDISEGASLCDAFRRHPRVFSPLYCSMVRAGEASGALVQILDRLIYILEHESKVKSDIRSALQYPIFITVFLCCAFFFLLTFVVPKFTSFYAQSGVALPLPTQICILMYKAIMNYGLILLVVVVAAILGLVYYLKTPGGQLFKDIFLLRIPTIGPLLLKAAMSRFASIFSILQSSGVSVLESMHILSETINNKAIGQEFYQITERLEEGRGIAGPLRSSRYFTPIVINMLAIGEESGNLEDMLNDIASHYDSELDYATKKLADSIVPVLTVVLAIVVGFFALAIYMPIVDLISVRTHMGP
jgi:type II secretory pathway component PulF